MAALTTLEPWKVHRKRSQGPPANRAGPRVAYPGFIESHGHLSSLGEAITNLDLNGVDSYQTIVGMVARPQKQHRVR